jgi:hypothetical protein
MFGPAQSPVNVVAISSSCVEENAYNPRRMSDTSQNEGAPSGTPSSLSDPAARLHVILARKAPVGVIFRRGSSKWVHIVQWNTDSDTFEYGQWFHGQMYPRRSDLSPNGKLLVYFCAKWSKRRIEEAELMLDKERAGDLTHDLRLLLKRKPKVRTEYTYAWTAVSKPPYLTALGLWPKGDCWHGGGLFKSNRVLWLNHKPLVAIPHKDHLPVALRVENNPSACGEDDPIYSLRLERDGWKKVQDLKYEWTGIAHGFKTHQPEIRVKASRRSAGIKLLMNRSISLFKSREGFSVVKGKSRRNFEGRNGQTGTWQGGSCLLEAAVCAPQISMPFRK